jgi:hypothetical protein
MIGARSLSGRFIKVDYVALTLTPTLSPREHGGEGARKALPRRSTGEKRSMKKLSPLEREEGG